MPTKICSQCKNVLHESEKIYTFDDEVKCLKCATSITEPLDETFSIISKKEKKLKEALVKTEGDYISTEINLGVCGSLIEFYKAEIKKEQEKNK